MFEIIEIIFVEVDFGIFEVFRKIRGGAIIGSDWDSFVVSCENDGGRPVVVDIGVVSVAYSKQIGADSEGDLFTFINKGDPLAWSYVDGAVDTVDDVEGTDLRVDEDLGVLASDYP